MNADASMQTQTHTQKCTRTHADRDAGTCGHTQMQTRTSRRKCTPADANGHH